MISTTWGLYPSSSNVVELTPSNFDKLVIKGDEIWIVEFFAPWCGHCQQLVPEYTKAAAALKVRKLVFKKLKFDNFLLIINYKLTVSAALERFYCSTESFIYFLTLINIK